MVKALKVLNLVFFLIMIAINAIANTLPLGYGSTGEMSAKYPNLFTPAPVTFAIWGVIYILMAIFAVFQLGLIGNEEIANNFVRQLSFWFVISCLMNIGWIFSWHYDVTWLSMLFIVGLLISLIVITSRISPNTMKYVSDITDVPAGVKISRYGFDIYLGWITAATIANASVLLVKIKWDRFGLSSQFWTIAVIAVAAILGVLFISTRHKYLSALAIIWALCGVMIKHISQAGYAGAYPVIIAATIIGIVIILSASVISCLVSDM